MFVRLRVETLSRLMRKTQVSLCSGDRAIVCMSVCDAIYSKTVPKTNIKIKFKKTKKKRQQQNRFPFFLDDYMNNISETFLFLLNIYIYIYIYIYHCTRTELAIFILCDLDLISKSQCVRKVKLENVFSVED